MTSVGIRARKSEKPVGHPQKNSTRAALPLCGRACSESLYFTYIRPIVLPAYSTGMCRPVRPGKHSTESVCASLVSRPEEIMVKVQLASCLAPGLRAPGLSAPGLRAPGLRALGLRALGLRAPGLRAPGLTGPGLRVPGLRAPGLLGPQALGPQAF